MSGLTFIGLIIFSAVLVVVGDDKQWPPKETWGVIIAIWVIALLIHWRKSIEERAYHEGWSEARDFMELECD